MFLVSGECRVGLASDRGATLVLIETASHWCGAGVRVGAAGRDPGELRGPVDDVDPLAGGRRQG